LLDFPPEIVRSNIGADITAYNELKEGKFEITLKSDDGL
jgi:hypothetical protein